MIVRKGMHHIYFPADGTRPTTKEIVEYSCANVDNSEDSSITKWYMQMFGICSIDKMFSSIRRSDFIKSGFSENIEKTPVISFNPNFIFKKEFIKFFMKISSTSAGRVLLYRLLIEIRRRKSGNQSTENGIPLNYHYTSERAKNLCLEIRQGSEYMPICFGEGAIYFSTKYKITPTVVNFISSHSPEYIPIFVEFSNFDTDLFHEMVHWFHALRHPTRFAKECSEIVFFLKKM